MTFEERLSDAMRQAMSDVRPRVDLAKGGLERGRRMRRTRMVQTGAAVAVAALVAVTGSVAAASAFGDNPVEGAGPLTSSTPTTQRSPDPAAILKSMLPPGGRIRAVAKKGPSVSLVYHGPEGASVISLSVNRHPAKAPAGRVDGDCAPVQARPYETCTTAIRGDGSRLIINHGLPQPPANKGESRWFAVLTRTDGLQIRLEQFKLAGEKRVALGRPDPVLTPGQMGALVTSPKWDAFAWMKLGKPSGVGTPEHPGDKLIDTLKPLLPAGVKITYRYATNGYATVQFDDGKGKTMIEVNVQPRMRTVPGCAERLRADPIIAICKRSPGPDGTIMYLQEHAAERPESGVIVRTVDVLYPDGLRISVTANGISAKDGPKTRGTPALTLDQLRAIATHPSWRS